MDSVWPRRKKLQVLLHASCWPEEQTWAARMNECVGQQYGGSRVAGRGCRCSSKWFVSRVFAPHECLRRSRRIGRQGHKRRELMSSMIVSVQGVG